MVFGLFGKKEPEKKKLSDDEAGEKMDIRAMIKAENALERAKLTQPRSLGAPITDESIAKDIYNNHFYLVAGDILLYNFQHEIVDRATNQKEIITTPKVEFEPIIHMIENIGIRLMKNKNGQMVKTGETDIKLCKECLEILFKNISKFEIIDSLPEETRKSLVMKGGNEAAALEEALYFGGGKMKIWYTLQTRPDIRYGTSEIQNGRITVQQILETELNITQDDIIAFVKNLKEKDLFTDDADRPQKILTTSPLGKKLLSYLGE